MIFQKFALNILLWTSVAGWLSSTSTSDSLNSWTKQDLQDFLKDHHLAYKEKDSLDKLRDTVEKEWGSQKKWWNGVQQKVLKTASNADSSVQNYKDWIFKSWSKSDLYKFIQSNGIPLKEDKNVLTNSQLIETINDNWDKIVQNLRGKSSGSYPGEWLYQHWTTASIKRWLDHHGIQYSASDTREALLQKVRENIYTISKKSDSSIDWVKKKWSSMYSNLPEVPDVPFDMWTSEDVKKFLKAHKASVEGSAADVKQRARELYEKSRSLTPNFDVGDVFDSLSTEDLKMWLASHKKSTEGSVDELYNRCVETYDDLVKNAVKHSESKAAKFFDGWSLDELKAWLAAHKQTAEGNLEKMHQKAVSVFESAYPKLAITKEKSWHEKQVDSLKSYWGYYVLGQEQDNFLVRAYKRLLWFFNW